MLRLTIAVASLAALTGLALAQAQGPGDPKPVANEGGKYSDAEGHPTFNLAADGTVDFHTFSGFRRYHSECHVCHGPDGLGSSYAPSLVERLKELTYEDFTEVVVNGKHEGSAGGTQYVMPSFGTNLNVMCYLDDIYVYLRARSQADLPRGRPAKREDKPPEFAEAENACMGST